MKRKDLLIEVTKRIQRNEYSYQIKKYLESKGLSEEKQDEILAEAKKNIRDEKLKKLPLQNKIIYYIFLALTIAIFILFVFIVPRYNIYNSSNFYAAIGTLLFVIFAIMTIVYKSRTSEESVELQADDKLKTDYGVLGLLALIPTVILLFLLIWRYSHTEDAILKETQVHTTGIITSGISTSSRSYSSSTVIVEFTTLEGKKMSIKEEVGSGEFRTFYKGQRVNMIYSSRFPSIIELLTNKAEIRDFTGAVERDISPQDLMAILKDELLLTEASLNKISYGWKFDEKASAWGNESKKQYLTKTRNQVIFVTDLQTSYSFTNSLKAAGFGKKTIKKEEKGFDKFKHENLENRIGGVGIYESDDYLLEVSRQRARSNTYIAISMIRK